MTVMVRSEKISPSKTESLGTVARNSPDAGSAEAPIKKVGWRINKKRAEARMICLLIQSNLLTTPPGTTVSRRCC